MSLRISAAELGVLLGVHRSMVYHYERQGRIPARLNNAWDREEALSMFARTKGSARGRPVTAKGGVDLTIPPSRSGRPPGRKAGRKSIAQQREEESAAEMDVTARMTPSAPVPNAGSGIAGYVPTGGAARKSPISAKAPIVATTSTAYSPVTVVQSPSPSNLQTLASTPSATDADYLDLLATPANASMSKHDLDRKVLAQRAEEKRLSNEVRRGNLVPVEDIESATERRFRADAEALLGWPGRVSREMAAELGVQERLMYTVLDRAVRAFMAERSKVGEQTVNSTATASATKIIQSEETSGTSATSAV